MCLVDIGAGKFDNALQQNRAKFSHAVTHCHVAIGLHLMPFVCKGFENPHPVCLRGYKPHQQQGYFLTFVNDDRNFCAMHIPAP